jgi:hypothetical protein
LICIRFPRFTAEQERKIIMRTLKVLLVSLLSITIFACGGGGGSAGSPSPNPPPPVTSNITIKSVDNTNPLPMTVFNIATSGLNSTKPVSVKFANSTGYSVASAPLNIATDGTVTASAPLYLDPTTHAITTGMIQLTISQGTSTSAPVNVSIQDLPSVASYGATPGQITHNFLVFESLLHASAMNVSQAAGVASIPNTSATTHGYYTLLNAAVLARNDTDLIMQNPSQTFSWGTAPDGTALTFSATDLDIMDRILGLYLSQVLTNAAPGVKTAMAQRNTKSVQIMSIGSSFTTFLSGITGVSNIQEAVNNFLATQDGFVRGEAIANAAGGLLDNPVFTKIGGGLGAAAAFSSVSRALDTIGSDILTVGNCLGSTSTTCSVTPDTLINDGLEFVKADVSTITSTTGFFGFESTLATTLSNGLTSVLTTVQGINDGSLNLPSIASPWISKTTLVQNAISSLGQVIGTVNIANNLGLAAAQTSVQATFNPSMTSPPYVQTMADQAGNYALYVPLGVGSINYSTVNLTMFDLLTLNVLASTSGNLSTLVAPNSITAPTTSGTCNDSDRGTDVNDDPDCD